MPISAAATRQHLAGSAVMSALLALVACSQQDAGTDAPLTDTPLTDEPSAAATGTQGPPRGGASGRAAVAGAQPASEQRIYRNDAHGYQVTLPAEIELQVHHAGQFVIVPNHGSLFGIWMHAEATTEEIQTNLLTSFERWCSEDPECARERQRHGETLRLVSIARGPFAGYKAVAATLPDTAPTRFYAFESPQQDGYFGFNLTPRLAAVLVESLEPLAAISPAK